MKLTLSVRSFQVPATPGTSAWPPSLPSVPTSRATRVTSEAKPRSWSTIVLIVSLSSRISPRTSTVIFFERSPFATAVVTAAMLRTWPVRLLAIRLTLSVRSFQVPATPLTRAWPPSLPSVPTSRATRVTSEANELELVHHRVHDAGGAQELAGERPPVEVERHRLREVALRDGADHARRLGRRLHQVRDERVDVLHRGRPGAAGLAERGPLVHLALLADGAAQLLELGRHALVHLDRLVEGVGDLARDPRPFLRQPDGEVAFLEGVQGGEQLARIEGFGHHRGVHGHGGLRFHSSVEHRDRSIAGKVPVSPRSLTAVFRAT